MSEEQERTCGTCASCYDDSPFSYVSEIEYLGKRYGICFDVEDQPVVVDLDYTGDYCPCGGTCWNARRD